MPATEPSPGSPAKAETDSPPALSVDEDLRKRTAELQAARQTLDETRAALAAKDAALREVLNTIEAQKQESARATANYIDNVVMPLLHSLLRHADPASQRVIKRIEEALHDSASPFAHSVGHALQGLTPVELRICCHIRRGLASKEIALLERMSVKTANTHRRNIRRKLDLTGKKQNLAARLAEMIPVGHNP